MKIRTEQVTKKLANLLLSFFTLPHPPIKASRKLTTNKYLSFGKKLRKFFWLLLFIFLTLSLLSCQKKSDLLQREEVAFLPLADDQLKGIKNEKNNFFLEGDKLIYQPFFSYANNKLALLNTSEATLFLSEDKNTVTIKGDVLKNAKKIFTSEDITVVLTLSPFRSLGIAMVSTKGKTPTLTSLFPLFPVSQNFFTDTVEFKRMRSKKYLDKTIHLKVTSLLLAKIMEERFVQWFSINPSSLLENYVNSSYLDYYLDKDPQKVYLIIEQSGNQADRLIKIFDYSLNDGRLEEVTSFTLEQGVYFDTTKAGEFVASSYDADKQQYLFDFYSLPDGNFLTRKKFPVQVQNYPKDLVYNGEELIGFYMKKKGISINRWTQGF